MDKLSIPDIYCIFNWMFFFSIKVKKNSINEKWTWVPWYITKQPIILGKLKEELRLHLFPLFFFFKNIAIRNWGMSLILGNWEKGFLILLQGSFFIKWGLISNLKRNDCLPIYNCKYQITQKHCCNHYSFHDLMV